MYAPAFWPDAGASLLCAAGEVVAGAEEDDVASSCTFFCLGASVGLGIFFLYVGCAFLSGDLSNLFSDAASVTISLAQLCSGLSDLSFDEERVIVIV